MGSCCNKEPGQDSQVVMEYSKSATLNVTRRNYVGKTVGTSRVTFENTSPINQKKQNIMLGKKNATVYGCIVPGLDPRGEMEKECQDNYIFLYENNSILCALFDGHGKEGQKVANFCVNYVVEFFKDHSGDLSSNTEEALTILLEKCDEKLRSDRINSEMSGSTAVLVYINESTIYSASLGDSRAIISTLSDVAIAVPVPSHKYFKPAAVKRNLKPVPLTTDQKPNHEDEFERIKAAGGSVEQITDGYGAPVGPYRVWVPKKDYPGLAMSRSIGDRIAKRIGVIATPVCHNFQLYPADQFIVIASDGVWDVMENIEVVNFIEKYKKNCTGESDFFPAKPENSSIARLLCEEARFRWYGIIEAEDVMVDDISCIIVDFEEIQANMKGKAKERNVKAFQSLAIASSSLPHTNSNVSINHEENQTDEEADEETQI